MITVNRVFLFASFCLLCCACWFSGRATGGCGPTATTSSEPSPVYDKPKCTMTVPATREAKTETIEQLIRALTEVKAKKDELAKREQALVSSLQKKLQEQQATLRALGVPVTTPAIPPGMFPGR
jgi:hypothetical protein